MSLIVRSLYTPGCQRTAYAGGSGNELFEEPQTFGNQFWTKESRPRDIPAWPSEASDEPVSSGVRHSSHDNGDCVGHLLGCQGPGRGQGDEHINLERQQLGRKGR